MNPYIALAAILLTAVAAFFAGGVIGRLSVQSEIDKLKWTAVAVIAENRAAGFTEGEAAAQARIALAQALGANGDDQ